MTAPSSLQKRAKRIEIASRRLVDEQLAGQYQSLFKGRGLIFSDVRPYTPGDDVRTIDWNVSARMNAPHVKQFVEERDRSVFVVIDLSRSQLWGARGTSKGQMAAELAALVVFAAIANNDRVGLIIVTDRVERYLPPQKSRRHALRMVAEILNFEPRRTASRLEAGFELLGKISKRRSLVFVVSDFLPSGDLKQPSWDSALRVLAQRNDVICSVVADPIEKRLPEIGLVALEDLETGEIDLVDTTAVARKYRQQSMQWQQLRDSLLRRSGADLVQLATDSDYLAGLARYFRERSEAKGKRARR